MHTEHVFISHMHTLEFRSSSIFPAQFPVLASCDLPLAPMAQRKRQRGNDTYDDDDESSQHSDDDIVTFDDITDFVAGEATDGEATDEPGIPSHLLISLIIMMMCLVCSCFTVLHKAGSGNYDHGATTTRDMRLRLPDIAGHIEILGTRAYRLLNWADVLYRSVHCDRECFMLLVTALTPWLLLPRRFSVGFFNPDKELITGIPLATWQAMAAAGNSRNSGRKPCIDVLGLIITYLQRVCTCSAFVLQAELNLASMSSVHRALRHVGWAICQALHGNVDVPPCVTLQANWARVPKCIQAHFGQRVIWGAVDDTLQVRYLIIIYFL